MPTIAVEEANLGFLQLQLQCVDLLPVPVQDIVAVRQRLLSNKHCCQTNAAVKQTLLLNKCCCQTNSAVKQTLLSNKQRHHACHPALGVAPNLPSEASTQQGSSQQQQCTLFLAKHVSLVIAVTWHYKVTTPSLLNLCQQSACQCRGAGYVIVCLLEPRQAFIAAYLCTLLLHLPAAIKKALPTCCEGFPCQHQSSPSASEGCSGQYSASARYPAWPACQPA